MIDEEKLEQLLEDNYGELYAALQKMNVEDFIAEYKDKLIGVPGFIELYQNSSSNAPHNMTQEQVDLYFDKDVDKERYKQSENQLAKELAEKQKIADEYQRSKDDSYYNKEIGPLQLANEYARKQHIKGNDKLAALNEAAAKVAFASDFAPFPVSLIGPTIRYAQKAGNEDEWLPDLETITDFGTSMLGPAKGAAKAGYEGIKQSAGPLLGKMFNTKPAKAIEKSLEAIDARELAKDAAKHRKEVLKEIDDFSSKFNRGKYTEEQALEFANRIEADYPELAQKLRDHVNALSANRQAADKIASAQQHVDDAEFIAKKEADDIVTSNKLPDAKENARVELKEAQDDAAKSVYKNEVFIDAEGNLVFPVKDLKTQYDLYKAGKSGTKLANVSRAASKPAIKSSFRTYNDNTDYSKYEKENKAAIDWTIDKYKRQWDAGFAPRGNEGELIMKAYAQYLKDREGK